MKKLIIKNVAAAAFIFISFSAIGQTAERKPVVDEGGKSSGQEKTATATPAPQIVAAPKAMTVSVQPKPVVPGGEFKPMDTNVPVKNYSRNTPEEKITPVQLPSQKQQ